MSKPSSLLLALLVAAGLLFWLLLQPGAGATPAGAPLVERVSVGPAGLQANGRSLFAGISADGRYVAFNSEASNLVSSDTNNLQDVFVHDRQTGLTSRISVASDGAQGNGTSGDFEQPSLSADGRYIAFTSAASNLVISDTNGFKDTFVYDQQTATTVRVSVASDGSEGNWFAEKQAISADGRFVAFITRAALQAGDTNNAADVYVHDRDADNDGLFDEPGAVSTVRVSVATDGSQANFGINYSDIAISADGRHVTFDSQASNLVPGDTNNFVDVFVHDRDTDDDGIFDEPGAISTYRVSVADDGTQGNQVSSDSDISADGRYIVFWSQASNLVPADLPECLNFNCFDIFFYDRDTDNDGLFDETGATSLRKISVSSSGVAGDGHSYYPNISADGSAVAFYSIANNLVPGDPSHIDVFIHEPATGVTSLASVTWLGGPALGSSFMPAISGDGQLVAFSSQSQFLVPDDTNNTEDVFVHNRQGALPTPTATASLAPSQTPTPNASLTPTPSPSPSATPSAQPPTEGWQLQTLAVSGRTGQGAALVLDNDDLPHISYRAVPAITSKLHYMHWDGVVWQTSVVDDSEDTGYDSDILLDNLGRPQISYRGNLGRLHWAVWDGSQWVRELAHAGPSVGYQTAIALHPTSQQTHILHVNILTGELLHTRRVSNGWLTAVVAQNVPSNSRNDLTFDLNGVLHATYFAGDSLQYATWDGSNWSSTLVDDGGNVGLDSSLAFNSANRPQISYHDISNNALKYAYFNGTSWQRQFVNAPGDGGRSSSIALDSSDTVFISYYAGGHLGLAERVGAAFDVETLDEGYQTGAYSSLALDSSDTPHIAYFDEYYGDLKYLTWGPSWEFRPVHPGNNSQEPSLALEGANPGLTYYNFDIVPDEIAYARWDGEGWPSQHVLANGGGSAHTALRYGRDGQPRLASISAQNRSLSYRRWDGAGWQAELVEEVQVGDLGHDISLLLDPLNQPTIVYSLFDGANRRIRLAWYDGSSWQFSSNDVSPPLGSNYALAGARSTAGTVHVAYYEMAGGDLRLATWDGVSWQDELVDDGNGVDTGRFPAIALDTRLIDGTLVDIVAIGYYDATNQNVNYAYRDTSWHTQAAVFNTGPISSLDMVLGNEAWLTPYIAYTALNDNSLRLTYSADGLQSFPLEILVAGLNAPPDQVSLAFDYAPRLAYRDDNGGLQYAFPGSRHHIGPAPAHSNGGVGALAGFDGHGCLSFSVRRPTSTPFGRAPLVDISSDEAILGGVGELFSRTPAGRRYIDLYATHIDEMAHIAWSDPGLAWDAYRTLHNLMPGLTALVNDAGSNVIVTQTMVDQALDVWQQLAAQASPELAAVINGELAATDNLNDFVDRSFDDWALGVGVLPPGNDAFLPIVKGPAGPPSPAPANTLAPAPVAALPETASGPRRRGPE